MDVLRMEVATKLKRGDVSGLFALLGWTPADIEVGGDGWRAWCGRSENITGRVVAKSAGCRVLVVDGGLRRELVTDVHRRAPLATVLWVFRDRDEVVFALADRDREARVFLRTLSIHRQHPDPMGLERVCRFDGSSVARPEEPDPAAAVRTHLAEVLDQQELTAAFFRRFKTALDRMHASILRGPTDENERRDIALVVLLRLVFLYFLQRESLLDGDPRYLVRHLRQSLKDRKGYYTEVLRPLFFGVLNTPIAERDKRALALGAVPFLNGGLFEPTHLESAHPQLSWTNEVLSGVIEELFERFHFTAIEPTGRDEAQVVDPEMLGKVFEGLMHSGLRQRSGAFYTPRDVVRQMIDEALDAHLADKIAADIHPNNAFDDIRILDPAVGTGAFLLEALAALRNRRRQAGLPVDYAATRQVVHDHLFGVDRNPVAVRLCELRIWLVLLSTLRDAPNDIEPLPNLSHRIVAGDSLLDGLDLWQRKQPNALAPAYRASVRRKEEKLKALQHQFLLAHGGEKALLRREISALEKALQIALLDARSESLQRRIEPLRALASSMDLFGECIATRAQAGHLRDLSEQMENLQAQRTAVLTDETAGAGFGYETRFGAIAREGFDIIATNPPWVRTKNVDKATRELLRLRYQTASGAVWKGADQIGIRAAFGGQPDLAALFVERSLELLRPGGRLTALIPAKLLRGLHGSALRSLLAQHSVEQVDDLSDARRRLFNATVYPAVLRVKKARADQQQVAVTVWRRERSERFNREARLLTPRGEAGEPWLLVPDLVEKVLRRVRHQTTPLGNLLQVRRGIFTGANDIFVRPRGGFVRELGDEVLPFVRPLLTGAGLGETPRAEILWCYDGQDPLSQLPTSVHRYFEQHTERLQSRADHDTRRSLWQVFRVTNDTEGAKVAWRDLSVLLDPVEVPAGSVALNTVYYVPFEDAAEAAGFSRWMASPPVRAHAYAIAERARGGWRRHFAWVVRMLPVPPLPGGWAMFDERAFQLSDTDRRVLDRWLNTGEAAA